ncbi:MAG: hypothetical protein ACHQ2Y_01160 [Candidatus Lutacidiplasmatales archaeon]
MNEAEGRRESNDSRSGSLEGAEEYLLESLRLGRDVRFVLAAVGGGAIRIARDVARRHLRHLETVAINCDHRVQALDEFDRTVSLGRVDGEEADTGGSPSVGSLRARSAEPALQRIFEGATFVTILGSLGGGSGTGALPHVLEAASREAAVVSVFLVKPFACEGERRAVAERAIANLHFVEAFVDKQQQKAATLRVLDNESFARRNPSTAFGQLNRHFGDLVFEHIERSFVAEVEAAMEGARPRRPPTVFDTAPPASGAPSPPAEVLPPMPSMSVAHAELTFEVVPPSGGPEMIG